MRNIAKKYGPRIAAFGSGALVVPAFAAVPEAFTEAVANATADGSAMALALVGVAAAIVVVKIAMAYVKGLKGAAK